MHCADASQLMDEILDRPANSELQAALLAHTADCAACRAEWLAIQQVDRLLATAPLVSPPSNFTTKVMAHLPRRRPARNLWAGALALFAGTSFLLLVAVMAGVGLSSMAGLIDMPGSGGAMLLQLSSALIRWAEAGWEIRRVVLSLIPSGVIALYALVSLVAIGMWLGLVAGVQGALQPADMHDP